MKIKDITIRKFHIEDYDAVTTLWAEAGIHYRPNGRESRTSIAKELKSGQAIFLVATVGERVVGVVLGTQDGRKGWINRLAVAKTSADNTSPPDWLSQWKPGSMNWASI